MERLYFDNAASTPLDSRVRDVIYEVSGYIGNPSALHEEGRRGRAVIDGARDSVADLLGVNESEVIFTSGATEANWLGISGYINAVRSAHPGVPLHVLTTSLEHASMKAAMTSLSEDGVEVEVIPTDKDGRISANDVQSAIKKETVLVSVMWVNNLFGTVQPIAEIGSHIRQTKKTRGKAGLPIVLFSDAVQAIGTQDVYPDTHHVDMLSLSGHKIYGPKGVGALFVSESVPFMPKDRGGGQERGKRAGTENVSAIAGLGEAARIVTQEREIDRERISLLNIILHNELADTRGYERVVGESAHRAPHIVYAFFQSDADTMVVSLDVAGIAVSSGSACDTGTRKTSDVLRTVSSEKEAHKGGVRISLGRFTSEDDVHTLVDALRKISGRK